MNNLNTKIYVPKKSRIYDTALYELVAAFKKNSLDGLNIIYKNPSKPEGIILALINDSPLALDLISSGVINLHNVDPSTDAYEIISQDKTLYILGNTPRGLLHGVYELQELLVYDSPMPDDFHIRGTFHIPMRIFHQRFDNWPGERADIRYISHLGATHCLVTHDWQGDLRLMQGYVTSPIFPSAVDKDAVQKNQANLRCLIDSCLDYGLETALWITELPCQGGPWTPESIRQKFLTRFPEEILSDTGTYQGKVLCFSHHLVQNFYRDIIKRFFEKFPEISILFVMGLDSNGEFCDPDSCPRCKGMSKFEQRDRLLRFLIEEGQKVRPGLRVLTTSWGWELHGIDEFLYRQSNLPSASGLFMAAELDGWQPERQCHDFLRNARQICKDNKQIFIGYDNFHWGDDTVHSLNDIQDYPLGIGAKIRRWHELCVDGVFDHWGGFNQDISCNSIVLREFFLNPLTDPNALCLRIAGKQFGNKAGFMVYKAWESLEKAHAILSNSCIYPPSQWPGWYSGRNFPPTPDNFNRYGLGNGLPPKKAMPVVYNQGNPADLMQRICDAWHKAFPHYLDAVNFMKEALEKAEDKPLFYSYWWTGQNSPSQREHIRRQKIYLESMALVGREIGIHFGLNALYERVGRDPKKYRQLAEDQLRSDMEACLVLAEYFDKLKKSGDDRDPSRDWASLYYNKAKGIEEYLACKKQ